MKHLMKVRPKIRQNVILLQTREGAFVQSDEVTFTLKGKTIYQLLATLSPHMNGETTVQELCDGLEQVQQEMVGRLVEILLARGVVKEADDDPSDLLSTSEFQYFRPQIELIDHSSDHPIQRFHTFRQSRVLVIGSGESCIAFALSLQRNGLKSISLTILPHETNVYPLEAEAETLRNAGIATELSVTNFDSATLQASIQQYDYVVYCSDTSSLQQVLSIQKMCKEYAVRFLPVVFFAQRALLGPLVQEGGPCWLCAQARLAVHESEEYPIWKALVLDHELFLQEGVLYAPLARQVGNAAAFELFKICAGHVPSELVGGIVCQESETLETRYGKLLPNPLCPLCSHDYPSHSEQRMLEVVTGKRDYESISDENWLQQLNPYFKDLVGICSLFEDDILLQNPIKLSKLTVRSPAGCQTLTAFHIETLLAARAALAREAIRQYTQSLPVSHAMHFTSQDELVKQGRRVIEAKQFFTWTGMDTLREDARSEWLAAFSHTKQAVCYVPASVVYPFSYLNRRADFEKTAAGSVAGTRFRELLVEGLCSALAYEHLWNALQGKLSVSRIDPEELKNIDGDLTFLLNCVPHFAVPYELFELATTSPVHVVCANTNEEGDISFSVVGVGLSGIEALCHALLQLIGTLQLRTLEGQSPMPKNTLFPGLRFRSDALCLSASLSRIGEPATSPEALERYVEEQGRELLFVNTTTTDIWELGTVISGTFLLTRPTT